MEGDKVFLFFVLALFLSVNFVFAELQTGYEAENKLIVDLKKPTTAINVSTIDQIFNASQFWITSEGDLNDVSNIQGSWITNDLSWITDGNTNWDNTYGFWASTQLLNGTLVQNDTLNTRLNGYAKYQFLNNNYNGSGAFTTTGTGRFDGGVGIGTVPSYPLHVTKNNWGSYLGYFYGIQTNPPETSMGLSAEINYDGTTSGEVDIRTFNSQTSLRYTHTGAEVYEFWYGIVGNMAGAYGSLTYTDGSEGVNRNLYGIYGKIKDNAKFTGLVDGGTVNIYGVYGYSDAENTEIDNVGASITYNNYGVFGYGVANALTETNGAFTSNIYGGHFNAYGKAGLSGGSTAYGVFVGTVAGADNKWAYYNDAGVDNFMGGDNSKSYFGTDKDASIYWDGTNLKVNTSTGDLYVTRNVSATGYITRTPSLKSYQADYLDKIKTPNEMLDVSSGKLNRADLLTGEAVMIPVTDPDNCWEVYDYTDWIIKNKTDGEIIFTTRKEPTDEMKTKYDVKEEKRYHTECGTKLEEGMSLDYVEMNNRLLISELKQQNQMLKDELCAFDNHFSWCSVGVVPKL